jgi:hypothetical protein
MCDNPLDLEMRYIGRVYLRGVAELAYKQARDNYVEKLKAYMEALRREDEALKEFILSYNAGNGSAPVTIKKGVIK